MPTASLTPKFFITHSRKDMQFARRLADDLRSKGLEGFFDVYSIKAGENIAGEINRGLEACDIYVPILSFDSLDSPWCMDEINTAITLSNQRSRAGRPRIIPVLVENCEDKMPAMLLSRLNINFTGRYDDALQELLQMGFGLASDSNQPTKQAAPAQSTPFISRPNNLLPWIIGISVVIIVLVCGICGAIVVLLPTSETPTSVAAATRVLPSVPVVVPTVVSPTIPPAPTKSSPPTAKPVPTPPCSTVPTYYQDIWSTHRQVGCPTQSFQSDYNLQKFDGGKLLWQKSPNPWIYALFNTRQLESQSDPGPQSAQCQETKQSQFGPNNGFGNLWCTLWKSKLGKPTTNEIPYTSIQTQKFDNGMILKIDAEGGFILDTRDSSWESF